MRDLERDVRDAEGKSGIWLLLGIVILGSAVQMLGMPSAGSAEMSTVQALTGPTMPDALPAGEQSLRFDAREESANRPAPGGVAGPGVAPPMTPATTEKAAPASRVQQRPETERAMRPSRPTDSAPRWSPAMATPASADAEPTASQESPREPDEAAWPSAPDAAGSQSAGTPLIVLPVSPAPQDGESPAPEPEEDEGDPVPGEQPTAETPADGDRGVSHDGEADDARIVVVGPATARPRDFVTFTITAENVKGLAHAPVRLAFDAQVLEYVAAEEGSFLKAGGATTQFLVAPGETPGTLDIALSRMGSASGIDGSGVLATVTFLARGPGMSPIVTAGSRFLDAAARGMALRSDDAYVSVQ